ncbi:hypothetical protein BH24ACT3_BH24ACT3_04350 [soil metagenome]
MTQPENLSRDKPASIPEVLSDLVDLVKTYARQETIDPLKHLGRFLGWGVAGAAALGIGTVLVVLAVLRVLQAETGSTFTGSFTWAPYAITLVIATIVVILAVKAIFSGASRSTGSSR